MGAKIVVDNFFDSASDLSVSPSAHANFPITNLQSDVRGDTWRSTALDQQVIQGTFGGDCREVSFWGIWPATSGSSLIGSTVRVQLYSDAAMLTEVYDSGTLDFFTATGTGWGSFLWGTHPWGVQEGDRTCRLAPKVRFFAGVAVSAFKITLTNAGGIDTSYFEARRIVLGDYVEAPYNPLLGAEPCWDGNSEARRSLGASLRRTRRKRWRALNCEIVIDSEAARAIWSDILHSCDAAKEIVFAIFEETDGERLFRDFIVLGSLEGSLARMPWENVDFHKLPLSIVES